MNEIENVNMIYSCIKLVSMNARYLASRMYICLFNNEWIRL